MSKISIRFYKDHKVRAVWDNKLHGDRHGVTRFPIIQTVSGQLVWDRHNVMK